jgi:hypothetical protein
MHIKCIVSSTYNILNLSSVKNTWDDWGNYVFYFLRKIVEFPIHFCLVISKGDIVENFEMEVSLVPQFKYAPVTSVDVERSFSHFKNLLRTEDEVFQFKTSKNI